MRRNRMSKMWSGVYRDNAMLFGSPHVQVRDKECWYFVKAKEYTTECRYVTGPRDGFLSVTENPCPYVKRGYRFSFGEPSLE